MPGYLQQPESRKQEWQESCSGQDALKCPSAKLVRSDRPASFEGRLSSTASCPVVNELFPLSICLHFLVEIDTLQLFYWVRPGSPKCKALPVTVQCFLVGSQVPGLKQQISAGDTTVTLQRHLLWGDLPLTGHFLHPLGHDLFCIGQVKPLVMGVRSFYRNTIHHSIYQRGDGMSALIFLISVVLMLAFDSDKLTVHKSIQELSLQDMI